MRDRKELLDQAKKNLNLTEAQQAEYEHHQKSVDIWRELIKDFSISKAYADFANCFELMGLDPAKQEDLNMFRKYNPETKKLEPLNFKATPCTKEGALEFIKQIDETLKQGEEIINYNFLATDDVNTAKIIKNSSGEMKYSVRKIDSDYKRHVQKQPAKVAKPNGFKRFTNRLFGWFKKDVTDYNKYCEENTKYEAELEKIQARKEAEETFVAEHSDSIQGKKEAIINAKKIRDKANSYYTPEDALEADAIRIKTESEVIEVGSGRSDKLLQRHQSYKDLSTIPVYKSKSLPMEGLALLSGLSVKANESIKDASTDITANYKLKEGETLADEEKNLLEKIAQKSNKININAKIIETFYTGLDLERMGSRGTAVVNGRKLLNNAAAEYDAGNKEPMVELLKDSLPGLIDYVNEVSKDAMFTVQSQFISETSKSIKELFTKDPELKQMVGVDEKDLNNLYGAANLIENVGLKEVKKYEQFNKYMQPGKENKEAYVESMLYREYVIAAFKTMNQNENKKASQYSNEQMKQKGEALSDKFTNKMDVWIGYSEYARRSAIQPSPLYAAFSTNPPHDEKLREQFTKDVLSSSVFKDLLTKNRDELTKVNFEKTIQHIATEREKELTIQKQKQTEVQVLN